MKSVLKFLLFVTIPVWGLPYIVYELAKELWKECSVFIDKHF